MSERWTIDQCTFTVSNLVMKVEFNEPLPAELSRFIGHPPRADASGLWGKHKIGVPGGGVFHITSAPSSRDISIMGNPTIESAVSNPWLLARLCGDLTGRRFFLVDHKINNIHAAFGAPFPVDVERLAKTEDPTTVYRNAVRISGARYTQVFQVPVPGGGERSVIVVWRIYDTGRAVVMGAASEADIREAATRMLPVLSKYVDERALQARSEPRDEPPRRTSAATHSESGWDDLLADMHRDPNVTRLRRPPERAAAAEAAGLAFVMYPPQPALLPLPTDLSLYFDDLRQRGEGPYRFIEEQGK